MKLQQIYKSDINRNINGVIQVDQDDSEVVKQELSEYIITKELRSHYNAFFNNYEKSFDYQTNKIGVWISGFFGSGKSHFLKMLSYLLSNRGVDGKTAFDYFKDKFDDPMFLAQIERCISVPTETILFNVDKKSGINKDKTAILKVFAKVFYQHMGFEGNDLKVAKLEQFITNSGKMDEFTAKFEEVNGGTWLDSRDSYIFFEDDIVECLVDVLGMSETAARNWFNGTETADISIDQLVAEIKKYIDSKGKDNRLIFMVDEIGQYIGSDSDLMLNLQSIVEEIGSKCGGRVWVMVTSQEAIDSVTKIIGDDFSKIQGRFDTRLSLSSSSVDEVIKKRILEKNDAAKEMLKMNYEKNSGVLKNLFTFNSPYKMDLKGYSGENEFVETYPFVPYQFKLMQNVFLQVRRHGNAGKSMSGGERSMLSGFQEAAQSLADKDENSFISFNLFYDTLNTFLESSIRRVIDRCRRAAENNDGLELYDVEVLKLLYLIRYVDEEIKANIDNITTLMVDRIDADKINMRQNIRESLDRLLRQNYIARNGDTYSFLTDDEQDIAREINQINIESSAVVREIANVAFGSIFMTKKFRLNNNDFAFDQMVDDLCIGVPGNPIKLRLVTDVNDNYRNSEQNWIMKSNVDNEAIVVMSDKYPYYNEIESAMKIRRFAKSRNVSLLPETIQSIIRGRTQQAAVFESRAKDYITKAIEEATFYVDGERLGNLAGSAKDKLEEAMKYLVEGVYEKLHLVRKSAESDADILAILNNDQLSFGTENYNLEAIAEVEQFMDLQYSKLRTVTMGDIQRRFQGVPYGWREIDIAAMVAELVVAQKITVNYAGNTVQPSDRSMPDYLRRKSEIDKTVIRRRITPPEKLMKQARDILREYFNVMDVPSDEDRLIEFIIDSFTKERDDYSRLLSEKYRTELYPDKAVVENGLKLCNDVLSQKKDNIALLKRLVQREDDLLDQSEDMVDVNSFFKNQQSVFDMANGVLGALQSEKDYFQANDTMQKELSTVSEILKLAKPYKRISELPGLIQSLQSAYDEMLNEKREEVYAEIRSAMGEIHQTANVEQGDVVERADSAFAQKKQAATNAKTLTQLDAMIIQLSNLRKQYIKSLMVPATPNEKVATAFRSTLGYSIKLKNEEEIDRYVAEIKDKLMALLDGNDVLHII